MIMDKAKLTAMSTVILMFEWALNSAFDLRGDLSDLVWYFCENGEADPDDVFAHVDEYLGKFRDSVYAELPPCPNGHSPRPKLDS
ncbi:hypothetical protein SEA_PACERPAUL_74 [Mycobacterium phage PacerPaul]|nr:hypothetical protein SEA_PACERPAUL_74 [Mycobacterium phage PacerPaul]QBI97042.1 hypothetical protein SEA_FRANCIS47_71 [Mycobacterium phage Francis47]